MVDFFNGIRIVESLLIPEKQPVLQLSEKVIVSPEFRTECNKKYLEWFGEEATAYMYQGNILMNPKNAVKLRLAASHKE